MAAVLSTRKRQAEGLSRLFRRDVAPGLAELERCRRQHRFGYVVALAGMLAGIFLVFLLVQNLEYALVAGVIVLAIGLLLMQCAQRGYTNQVTQGGDAGDLRRDRRSAP